MGRKRKPIATLVQIKIRKLIKNRMKQMSEQKRRYNFKAFVFGRDGDINFIIENATSDFGYNTKFEIELTPAERAELITVILTATKPGAN
jgi:hypothetical protein